MVNGGKRRRGNGNSGGKGGGNSPEVMEAETVAVIRAAEMPEEVAAKAVVRATEVAAAKAVEAPEDGAKAVVQGAVAAAAKAVEQRRKCRRWRQGEWGERGWRQPRGWEQ